MYRLLIARLRSGRKEKSIMMNKQKINKLMMHCNSQEDCGSCVLDDICIGSFWSETDENIDANV